MATSNALLLPFQRCVRYEFDGQGSVSFIYLCRGLPRLLSNGVSVLPLRNRRVRRAGSANVRNGRRRFRGFFSAEFDANLMVFGRYHRLYLARAFTIGLYLFFEGQCLDCGTRVLGPYVSNEFRRTRFANMYAYFWCQDREIISDNVAVLLSFPTPQCVAIWRLQDRVTCVGTIEAVNSLSNDPRRYLRCVRTTLSILVSTSASSVPQVVQEGAFRYRLRGVFSLVAAYR